MMKSGIHPKYFEISVKCACGHKFETRATVKTISVEICSNCHPFYTGKQKLIDTAGRIEKFNRKFKKALSQKKVRATAESPASPQESPAPQ